MDDFKALTRNVLIGSDATPVRERFLEEYAPDIEAFITSMEAAFRHWETAQSDFGTSEGGAHVSALVYGALTTHVVSMKLLLEGLLVPAGNAQRYVLESIAMALLAADSSLGFREKYARGHYSTSKAIRDLKRHAKKLQVFDEGARQLDENARFYDMYSHPTLLTLASFMTLQKADAQLVFGSVFDEGKRSGYDREVHSRVSLAAVFPNFIDGVHENFQ